MSGALAGIRVLDWTNYQLGPAATMMLADMGADVIKIENREIGDLGRITVGKLLKQTIGIDSDRNFYFETYNRNKRSVTIDLKMAGGREILYRLVEKSDALVTNVRLDAAAKLGADYETLAKINPRLVYAHASGYGAKGPASTKPGFDALGLARSGVMDALAPAGMPPQWPTGAIGDQIGGTLLSYSVLAGLVCAQRTGRGQMVSTSLLGSCMWVEQLNVNATLMLNQEQPKFDRTKTGNPIYNFYQCQDGRWIFFALFQSDRHWPDFCAAAGVQHLQDDPRFAKAAAREENCQELIRLLDQVFLTKPSSEWVSRFNAYHDLVFDLISPLSNLATDPQVLANGYAIDFEHPHYGTTKMLGFPISFDGTPVEMRRAAPDLGQHTEEVLVDVCGYTRDEVRDFRERRVI
ncbi:MAG: CoA transferase [Chloroflexota bacterium]|nr:MAG: CoA transferase [Chloroflexota bacterium]